MNDKPRPPVLSIPAQSASRKYHNQPLVIDGERFDSQAEAARYLTLLERQNRGQISGLRRQPRYVLQEAFRDKTRRMTRAITYVADFEYSQAGQLVAEDVKGGEGGEATTTQVWRVKAKLFRYRYPGIELRVVEA